jgi:hypothetical protein
MVGEGVVEGCLGRSGSKSIRLNRPRQKTRVWGIRAWTPMKQGGHYDDGMGPIGLG